MVISVRCRKSGTGWSNILICGFVLAVVDMFYSVHTIAKRHHKDVAVLRSAAGSADVYLGETVSLDRAGQPAAVGAWGAIG